MTDTERLDFITQHRAWVSFAQQEANAGNPMPWRCQTFGSLSSFVDKYADGASPREAIDALADILKRKPARSGDVNGLGLRAGSL